MNSFLHLTTKPTQLMMNNDLLYFNIFTLIYANVNGNPNTKMKFFVVKKFFRIDFDFKNGC